MKFKLIKDLTIGSKVIKKNKTFDSFNGLVSGVEGVSFTNTEYFKSIKKKP